MTIQQNVVNEAKDLLLGELVRAWLFVQPHKGDHWSDILDGLREYLGAGFSELLLPPALDFQIFILAMLERGELIRDHESGLYKPSIPQSLKPSSDLRLLLFRGVELEENEHTRIWRQGRDTRARKVD